MIWWFVILALASGAVLWAAIAIYLRVRQAMKASHQAKDPLIEREHGAR
jgi:hypothetical protein